MGSVEGRSDERDANKEVEGEATQPAISAAAIDPSLALWGSRR